MARRNTKQLFVIKDTNTGEYFNKNCIYDAPAKYLDEEKYLNRGYFRETLKNAQIFRGTGVATYYMNQSEYGRYFSESRKKYLKIVPVELREVDEIITDPKKVIDEFTKVLGA